jgi:hypothetical protein
MSSYEWCTFTIIDRLPSRSNGAATTVRDFPLTTSESPYAGRGV